MTFTFPGSAVPDPGPGSPSLVVLVVDDNPMEFVLLQEAFLALGRTVELHTANGLLDGWRKLEELARSSSLPHLALVDLHLVFTSGVDLLRAMKDDPRFSPIPVVMMSVDTAELANPRLVVLGASGTLFKPRSYLGYVPMVEAALGHARAQVG